MVKKGLKGHIALFLIGESTDDPRVHSMLDTLGVWTLVRLVGPPVFHYGQAVTFIPRIAYHFWMQPDTSVYHREITKSGQFPRVFEEIKKPVRSPPVTVGTRMAAARGSLPFLAGGMLLHSLRPSFEFFKGDEVIS